MRIDEQNRETAGPRGESFDPPTWWPPRRRASRRRRSAQLDGGPPHLRARPRFRGRDRCGAPGGLGLIYRKPRLLMLAMWSSGPPLARAALHLSAAVTNVNAKGSPLPLSRVLTSPRAGAVHSSSSAAPARRDPIAS